MFLYKSALDKIQFLSGQHEYEKSFQNRNETQVFLTSETEPEYDNSISERLVRQSRRNSKAVISFRSSESASIYCDVPILIKSADQQGVNIYRMMKEGFSGTRQFPGSLSAV